MNCMGKWAICARLQNIDVKLVTTIRVFDMALLSHSSLRCISISGSAQRLDRIEFKLAVNRRSVNGQLTRYGYVHIFDDIKCIYSKIVVKFASSKPTTRSPVPPSGRTWCTYGMVDVLLYRATMLMKFHIFTFGAIETKNFAFPYLRCNCERLHSAVGFSFSLSVSSASHYMIYAKQLNL